MTSLASGSYAAHLQPEAGSVGAFFTKVFGGLAEGWTVWQTFRMLSAMRDDQLAGLGIRREDCARVAMFGRDSG